MEKLEEEFLKFKRIYGIPECVNERKDIEKIMISRLRDRRQRRMRRRQRQRQEFTHHHHQHRQTDINGTHRHPQTVVDRLESKEAKEMGESGMIDDACKVKLMGDSPSLFCKGASCPESEKKRRRLWNGSSDLESKKSKKPCKKQGKGFGKIARRMCGCRSYESYEDHGSVGLSFSKNLRQEEAYKKMMELSSVF